MAIRNHRIQAILKRYYEMQDRVDGGLLTETQRQSMVDALKKAYDSMTNEERRDVLVPANWRFIADHAICCDQVGSGKLVYDLMYNWPDHDGFDGAPTKSTLFVAEEYDRIGSAKGRYLAAISEAGKPASYLERALPYYIPEANICDSPAYHRYRVMAEYSGEGDEDRQSVWRGTVAHAFWSDPDDGGGVQVRLPKMIGRLGGVLNEV